MRSGNTRFLAYHSALLEYVNGGGEGELHRAYTLGREENGNGAGLLHLVRLHQRAVNEILESTPAADERMRVLRSSEEFLIEALSTFEMTCRGYLSFLTTSGDKGLH